jgi:2-hydroxy-3-keto-5-methylthiopentenyl-1-phosphate phosphatase
LKDFVFVSDFDGTLTEMDFYKMMSDKYLKEECKPLYEAWRNKKMKDVEYLSYVFNNLGISTEELDQEIMDIKLDPFAKRFIDKIKAANGEFVIISAGTGYYIDKVLSKHNIEGVTIYTNKGIFKDKGIYFDIDKNSEFYSDIYGIDKFLVVQKLKESYKKVFYAGDSGPDLKPALIADVVFARGQLPAMLDTEHKPYIEFKNFTEIFEKLQPYLKEETI